MTNNNERLEPLRAEIDIIQSPYLRVLAEEVLLAAPKCFWSMPASSTGKYHPDFALGDGGLVRHTRMVVRISRDLLDMHGILPNDHRYSLIVTAALLHDCCKKNDDELYTAFDHPIRAQKLIERIAADVMPKRMPGYAKVYPHLPTLCDLVGRHMGRWSTSRHSTQQLPMPRTCFERLLHTADYIASRKYVSLP